MSRALLLAAVFLALARPVWAQDGNLEGKYKGYNVILVVVDALRPDHLSSYGYGRETSPGIDALAKEGVLFENAYSQSSMTISSLASIFTSLYPYSHGMQTVFRDAMPRRCRTLAEILSGYGYSSAWFGPLYDPHTGLAPGMLRGFAEKEFFFYPDVDMPRLRSWLRKRGGWPFFLTVHLYTVHERWIYKRRYANRFSASISPQAKALFFGIDQKAWTALRAKLEEDPQSVSGGLDNAWVKSHRYLLEQPYSDANNWLLQNAMDVRSATDAASFMDAFAMKTLGSMIPGQLPEFLKLFDSAVYELDRNFIRPLVGELKRDGLAEKTIIIVTADHGNEFLERGSIGHGTLYEECLRVPLIFHIPKMAGARVPEPAASIDIMPTLLDLLGIPVPQQSQGISLAGLMERREDAASHPWLIGQTAHGTAAIRYGIWKLIRVVEWPSKIMTMRLYDVDKDPAEVTDLAASMPEKVAELAALLDAKQGELTDWSDGNREFQPGVSEQVKERIMKTGYW